MVAMEDGKVNKVSFDGRCWFGLDLKSFEISLETINGKAVRKIVERGRGLSSWIRIGEKSLGKLL